MGNTNCCKSDPNEKALTTQGDELKSADAVPVLEGELPGLGGGTAGSGGPPADRTYTVTFDKSSGAKLGLDVDYMAERTVLPIMNITGGLAEQWNRENPSKLLAKGDSIVEVNGIRHSVSVMLEKCKTEKVLQLTLIRAFTYDHLVMDLEKLISSKGCGPILVRLSWHDAGVFSEGKLKGGCPNAAMRFPGAGESTWPANAGLNVAMDLLKPISDKYCPDLISHADLWALAANVAIRVMGGPDVPTRFGRKDAKSAAESVESHVGRLPDGDKGAVHLREIFYPKGFDDRAIVALSGAHTVGKCHLDRSGFDGAWSEHPLKFDNSYFRDLLSKKYDSQTTAKGCPQYRNAATGTIMLMSDLALISDPAFKTHVEKYAADQEAFFADFTVAWVKLQELGCSELREIL